MTVPVKSYTFSNGTPADAAQVNANFDQLYATLAALDATNFAAASGVVDLRKRMLSAGATLPPGAADGAYAMTGSFLVASGSALPGSWPFPFMPLTDITSRAVSGKTLKGRVTGSLVTNGTAPGASFVFGLYPITSVTGTTTILVNLGTVTAGSTATITTPVGNTGASAVSGEFTLPVANNFYCLGVSLVGGPASGSAAAHLAASLDFYHV